MADKDEQDTVVEVDNGDGRGFQPVTELAQQVEQLQVEEGEEEEEEDFVSTLPKNVQLRVEALRSLHEKQVAIEEEFEKERKALEIKYEKRYQPLYQERSLIVSGAQEVPAVTEAQGQQEEADGDDAKGVPGFWLRALMNHSSLADMVQERDLPAFEFLIDIRSTSHESDNGFKLEFEFAENPFFANKVLSKEYDIGDASESGEAVLRNVVGTVIEWKQGKNLCEVTKKVKQRAKGTKETRVVSRTEPCESFFQFFTPVEMPSEDDEENDMIMRQLTGDFEIGFTIHESIVPQALLWFTGEAVEDDSDYDPEDDEEYEEDEESSSDDDEEGGAPKPRKGKKKKAAADAEGTEKPPECKNQ